MNATVDSSGQPEGRRLRATAIGFVAIVALTIAELTVIGIDVDRAVRVTALCGLLMAKVGLVLMVFLRVRFRRRDPRLAMAALFLAAGFAVVLMLEMAFRMRQR
jgi:heme/copper-type cytochrome/quinol oxidase subunit 4